MKSTSLVEHCGPRVLRRASFSSGLLCFSPRAFPVFALGPTSPLARKFAAPLNEKDKPLNEKYKSLGRWGPRVFRTSLFHNIFAIVSQRMFLVFALGATSPLAGEFVAPLNEKDKPLNEKYKSRGTLWAPCAEDIFVQ